VAAEEFGAKRMESAGKGEAKSGKSEQPLLHGFGGFVGEGNEEDIFRSDAKRVSEVGSAVDEDTGFT